MKDSRRNFIKKVMLASVGAWISPKFANAATDSYTASTASKLKLKKGSVILFQGDSITDAGRNKNSNSCNTIAELGQGYVLFTGSQILDCCAANDVKIYNRGISGNKVFQLQERWEKECISLKPDVISILIGVNDYWHTLSGKYDGTVNTYQNDYRALLKYTKEKLPDVQLVIGEPFTLKGGSAIDNSKWYPMFDEYRKVAKALAKEFNAIFVPYQSVFDEAMEKAPATYWSADGVHPDLPGRQLMANAWIKATGLK